MAALACHQQPVSNVVMFLWMLGLTVAAIFCSTSFIRVFKTVSQEKSFDKKTVIAASIAVFISIISLLSVCILIVGCIFDSLSLFWTALSAQFYSYGTLISIITAIYDVRLYQLFKHTTYAYSKYIFIALGCAFTCIIIAAVIVPVLLITSTCTQCITIIFGIAIIAFIFQTSSTIILFTSRLNKVKSIYLHILRHQYLPFLCIRFRIRTQLTSICRFGRQFKQKSITQSQPHKFCLQRD